MYENRYIRNQKMLTLDESKSLKDFKVCVVGCGGLGGHIIEMLARIGIGTITAVDGDVFDESNLNRQLLSEEAAIGLSKANQAKLRVSKINSEVIVHPIPQMLTGENGLAVIQGHDLVFDALDNIATRILLQSLCEEMNLPFVHGAIAGWYGQVTTIFPGDKTLHHLYKDPSQNKGIEQELGNPSFTPALVASIQVSEGIKVLLKKGSLLRGEVLNINLLYNEFETIKLFI